MKDKNIEDNKIFVFLSHSHLDYEKVRVVRDLLEKEGFRPLMFFLKCLGKKGYEKLTKKLIKEEIDNRHRFVLCDSKNAKESDWVQFEVKHIKETNRPYETVNLDWPEDQIEKAVKRFKRRSTVYISCPYRLIELARYVNRKLKLYDFDTYLDDYTFNDSNSYIDFDSKIREVLAKGYFLTFLDDKFSSDIHCFQDAEVKIALQEEKWIREFCNYSPIIPIVTAPLSDNVSSLFEKLNLIDVQGKNYEEASEIIINKLMKYDNLNNQ